MALTWRYINDNTPSNFSLLWQWFWSFLPGIDAPPPWQWQVRALVSQNLGQLGTTDLNQSQIQSLLATPLPARQKQAYIALLSAPQCEACLIDALDTKADYLSICQRWRAIPNTIQQRQALFLNLLNNDQVSKEQHTQLLSDTERQLLLSTQPKLVDASELKLRERYSSDYPLLLQEQFARNQELTPRLRDYLKSLAQNGQMQFFLNYAFQNTLTDESLFHFISSFLKCTEATSDFIKDINAAILPKTEDSLTTKNKKLIIFTALYEYSAEGYSSLYTSLQHSSNQEMTKDRPVESKRADNKKSPTQTESNLLPPELCPTFFKLFHPAKKVDEKADWQERSAAMTAASLELLKEPDLLLNTLQAEFTKNIIPAKKINYVYANLNAVLQTNITTLLQQFQEKALDRTGTEFLNFWRNIENDRLPDGTKSVSGYIDRNIQKLEALSPAFHSTKDFTECKNALLLLSRLSAAQERTTTADVSPEVIRQHFATKTSHLQQEERDREIEWRYGVSKAALQQLAGTDKNARVI